MKQKGKDWAKLATMPKFVELQSRKRAFLLTLWIVGSVSYYLLPVLAGYAPDFMKTKVIGRINVTYVLCLLEFAMTWGIALYYTYKTNTYFDQLTKEVVAEISAGGEA